MKQNRVESEKPNLRCRKCVWQHRGNDYLCDFATLAAPMTRGGVPPEKCRHFLPGSPPQNGKQLEQALQRLEKKLGR